MGSERPSSCCLFGEKEGISPWAAIVTLLRLRRPYTVANPTWFILVADGVHYVMFKAQLLFSSQT